MPTRLFLLPFLVLIFAIAPASADPSRHNVILFVPDGLRAEIVTPELAPTIADIRDKGVHFANSHSLFPTFTMPNSSGMFRRNISPAFSALIRDRSWMPYWES